MRVVYILVALTIVLGWLAFETRQSDKNLSQVFAAFAVLAGLTFLTAAIGLY